MLIKPICADLFMRVETTLRSKNDEKEKGYFDRKQPSFF